MKRLALALTGIGLSASVFAAIPATTDPTLVSIPQLPGGFVIGGTAYYLQPSFSHGDLDYASVNAGTTSPFASSISAIDPGYDWTWGINVGYIFPNTGNDINLSYFTFDSDDDHAFLVNPNLAFANIINVSNPGGDLVYSAIASKADYDLDQIDLTAGQFIDVGCRLILHPNVGLRWADLQRKIETGYAFNTTTESPGKMPGQELLSYATGVKEKSDFSGIGPLAGIDGSYYLGYGFGIIGHFDSALLVGNIDSSLDTATFTITGGTAFPVADAFNADSIARIVPVLDAKLGADYTYVFNNSADSDLTLEVGYQASKYFDAVDRFYVATSASSGIISSSFRRTANFGLAGPYASLTLHV